MNFDGSGQTRIPNSGDDDYAFRKKIIRFIATPVLGMAIFAGLLVMTLDLVGRYVILKMQLKAILLLENRRQYKFLFYHGSVIIPSDTGMLKSFEIPMLYYTLSTATAQTKCFCCAMFFV